MNLFRRNKKTASALEDIILRIADTYKDHQQLKYSREFLQHREYELALDSLVALASDETSQFPNDLWNKLANIANMMNLTDVASFCREQCTKEQ